MSTIPTPSVSRANATRFAALLAFCLVMFSSLCATPSRAQGLPIYSDSLTSGFQNWSWATVNVANTSPVQSGADSISVTYGAWQALALHCGTNINTTYYSGLSFWVNGGPTGGQQFNVHALNAGGANLPSVPVTNYIPGGVIPANTWVHVTIPLADLQAANLTDFNALWFQESTGNAQPVYYVDTISLTGLSAPPVVHVNVDATKALRTVDPRDFGVNTAIWDGYLGSANTVSLMTAAGMGVFRFPGGSASDDLYDWTVQQYGGQSTTPTFGALIDATGAQAVITTNYGSGSPQMAAAWVAYCNASAINSTAIGLDAAGRDWKTAAYWAALRGATPLQTDDGMNFLRVNHAAPYHFHQWEIGNEVYGTWEYDTHAKKNDPVTYAGVAKTMAALMKQVDPTIQVGVVATPSTDDWGYAAEAVTDPVTGVQQSGWTPELFATLHSINYVPDFVILHNYPGGGDSILLQEWSWAGIASSDRTMLTDYMGAAAANVQMLATENNTGTSGKQSVSLVDGLYCAESIGGLMQTEFTGMLWWDLRNGASTDGDNSPDYYGWRLYDDGGMIASGGGLPGAALDTPYPPYFAEKLVSKFARGGDTVVTAAADFPLLNVFATKRTTGGLSLLVVNTDPGAALNTQVSLTGYVPLGTATTYQYGEAEDTQQSMGATVDLTQGSLNGVGPTFSTTFPPYSMTVINLAPFPAPTITSFTPTSGPIGTVVTITGTNLTGVTRVRFHNASAKTFAANAAGTQLTVTVPTGAGTGTITVDTPGGGVTSAATFTVIPPPTITSFTPASGPIGAIITITGTNFGGTTRVRFHNASAVTYSVNAQGTQITVTVPSGAGTGTITVDTPGGGVTSAATFTVLPPPTITSFTPTSGPIGTVVTITGTNLTGVTRVRFHNASAVTYSVNAQGTQITVTVPTGAGTGTITVDTPGGGVTSAATFTVNRS